MNAQHTEYHNAANQQPSPEIVILALSGGRLLAPPLLLAVVVAPVGARAPSESSSPLAAAGVLPDVQVVVVPVRFPGL